MTDAICALVEREPGIVNVYSWPSGMRNEGPAEFSIYYDHEKTGIDDVIQAITEAALLHIGTVLNITWSLSPPTQDERVNEAMDPRNADIPALNVSVSQHPGANELEHAVADPCAHLEERDRFKSSNVLEHQ